MVANKKKWAFKVYQKKSWAIVDSPGFYPVVIEWSYGSKQTHALSLSVKPEQWNKSFQRLNVEKGSDIHPQAVKYNEELDRLAANINEIVDYFEKRHIPFVNAMILEKLLHPVSKMKVREYIVLQKDNCESIGAFGRADNFIELLEYLDKFDKDFAKRSFPEIDLAYVKKFVNKQLASGRKTGGISVNVRCLRRVLNLAISDQVGSMETYPFSNKYGTMVGKETYNIEKELEGRTRKRYIPKRFLVKFQHYIFLNRAHARTKAIFFLSFFARGINFKDMALLKVSDIMKGFNRDGMPIEYFTYRRGKSKKVIEVVINKDIREQIDFLKSLQTVDDYLLPIVTVSGLEGRKLYEHIKNKRQKFNKFIQKMTVIMGFPEGLLDVTSYFARHSFAMIMDKKTNHNINIVSQAMNHSKTETTRIYLEDFGRDDIAEYNDGLLDETA